MKREKLSKAAASGTVALIFLVLGFQAAIFTGNVFRYNREHRVDTVYMANGIAGQAGNDTGAPPQTPPLRAGYSKGQPARAPLSPDGDCYSCIDDSNKYEAGCAETGMPGSDGAWQVCDTAILPKSLSPGSIACPKPEPGGAGGEMLEIAGQTGNDRRGRSLDFARDDKVGARDDMEGEPGTAPVKRSSIVEKGLAPRQEPDYSDSRRAIAEKLEKKPRPEEFEFDPNTVTLEELVRLGFSEKQAQVIGNYRSKGGKYYSPSDFAKMYVVDSAAYARLKPYIRITKLDLNTADSIALISLRGIGPYYAHKILEYRRKLGGVFTSKEQLLEIEGLDADRFAGFAKGVETRPKSPRFSLWDADRSQLAGHPYIGSYAAKGIIRYRSIADTAEWSLQDLVENGVLKAVDAIRLKYLDIHP